MASTVEVIKGLGRKDLKLFKQWRERYGINSIGFNDHTLLTEAVREHNIRIVTFLLQKGADINAREEGGAFPLILAIRFNNIDMVRCLVKHGADITLQDSYDTLLTAAVEEADLEIIKLLLDLGANSSSSNFRGCSPFLIAILNHDQSVVEAFLVRGLGLEASDPEGDTYLLTAIYCDSPMELIKILIRYGAPVNEERGTSTPLTAAAHMNNSEVMKYLITSGASVNQVCSDGNTAVLAAVRQGNAEITEILLNKGARANEFGPDGRSLLGKAARHGYVDVVKVLLNKSASINMLSLGGETPLATAVQYRQTVAAMYLTISNANVCKVGDHGNTPLFYAVANQDVVMIQFLLDHSAHYIVDTVFLQAIATKNIEIVKLLKERGAKISQYPEATTTPLQKSLEINSFEMALYLLNSGANIVTDLDQDEISWIIQFLKKSDIDMVKLLTENGARINALSACGHTLLTKATVMENFDMVKYFLQQGADANQVNEAGLTPMRIAFSNDDFKTIQLLVNCGATMSETEQIKNPNLAMHYRKAQESRDPDEANVAGETRRQGEIEVLGVGVFYNSYISAKILS